MTKIKTLADRISKLMKIKESVEYFAHRGNVNSDKRCYTIAKRLIEISRGE